MCVEHISAMKHTFSIHYETNAFSIFHYSRPCLNSIGVWRKETVKPTYQLASFCTCNFGYLYWRQVSEVILISKDPAQLRISNWFRSILLCAREQKPLILDRGYRSLAIYICRVPQTMSLALTLRTLCQLGCGISSFRPQHL